MRSLCQISTDCILSTYPKTILAASYCTIQHDLKLHDWKMSHKIPIAMYIAPLQRHFQFFAYPEYDES